MAGGVGAGVGACGQQSGHGWEQPVWLLEWDGADGSVCELKWSIGHCVWSGKRTGMGEEFVSGQKIEVATREDLQAELGQKGALGTVQWVQQLGWAVKIQKVWNCWEAG